MKIIYYIKNIIIALPVILMLFVSEEIMIFTISEITVALMRMIQLVSGFALLIYVIYSKTKLKTLRLTNLSIYITLIVLSLLVTNDFRGGSLYLIFISILAYLVYVLYGLKYILNIFYRSMLIIASFSDVLYILNIYFHNLFNSLFEFSNRANILFKFALFTNLPCDMYTSMRNWGPFREPGVYQIYLVIALIYCLFFMKKISRLSFYILSITILTTLSTSAYICFFFVLIAYLIKKSDLSEYSFKKEIKKILFIIAFLVLILSPILFSKNNIIFGKLLEGNSNHSMVARIGSFSANFVIFLKSPFVGVGLTECINEFPIVIKKIYHMSCKDNTNSIFMLLASYGFFIFYFLLVRYFSFFYYNFDKKYCSLILYIVFCMLISSERIIYSPLFSLFWICGNENLNIFDRIEGKIVYK